MSSLAGRRPGRLDLKAVQSDDLMFVAQLEDQDGSPIDVSGWTLVSQVREAPQGQLLVDLTVETSADDGNLDDDEIRVSADASVMEQVGEGAWPWDLKRTAGGPSVRTILAGTMLVRPNITEA